jgi:hypothetical protein
MQISRLVRCLSFGLLILVITAVIPIPSFAGVVISVNIAPPVLPVYEQPACPGDGYIWTPGYWAWGAAGYYWVPGTWVMPPTVGVLWTPGYWGWSEGAYIWHAGYWGPHIGFYGGVNYGFGYFGNGYEGGYWRGPHFYYNRTVNNVTITNVHIYNKTVINNVTVNRVSYNGGRGGIDARPTREQEGWARERHYGATSPQMQHEHAAGSNRAFLASENHGRPAIAATPRPAEFHGREAVAPRHDGPAYRTAEDHSVPRPPSSAHYSEHQTAADGPHGNPHGNRGPEPEHNSPRSEGTPHEGGQRPNSYHPDHARPENGRPEGNGSHHENEFHGDRGHEQR